MSMDFDLPSDDPRRVAVRECMLEGSGPVGRLPEALLTAPTQVNVSKRLDESLGGVDPIWHYGFLFAPALTLGGGTFAVQRNIVGELVLGLPREPNLEQGMPWRAGRSEAGQA